jgi:ADP-heptose:LPS heptosyltransferase
VRRVNKLTKQRPLVREVYFSDAEERSEGFFSVGRKGTMLPSLFLSVPLPTKLAIFWRTHLAPESVAAATHHGPVSFLIMRLDGLGDVVLTTPLFRELKRAFPGSSCTVVVQDAFRPLLLTNPQIDEILGLRPLQLPWLPMRMRSLLSALLLYWRRLRGRRFDVAISPRWDIDDQFATLLCTLVDAKDRIGYTEAASLSKQRHNGGFDAAFSTCLPAGPVQHEVSRNLEIVRALGGKVEDRRLEVRLTQRDREFALTLLTNVPPSSAVIAIGIGSRTAGRQWPLKNYAESLTQLGKERRVQPVIVCSREESEEACKLANLLHREAIIVSGASLRKVCAVLERCDLFIGNDSGSAHLAGAMNCKVIVISRHPAGGNPNHANSPIRFAPFCDQVCVLQPAAGLDACTTECVSFEPHCITAVSVEQTVAAAREMLLRNTSSAAWTNMVPWHGDDSPPPSDPVLAVALKKVPELSTVAKSTSTNPL